MSGRVVRVAAGQGFWGDWLEAPVRQVNGGPIDYLMMDYLAEVTMSIMQKQKSRDPKTGYARDFVPLMERILPELVKRRIKVTSNAGGVNPRGCAEAVLEVARRLGLADQLNIGLVTGDDILGRLDELLAAGHPLTNMETGQPLADIRDKVLSANAYLGMAPMVEALGLGADVVITGRVTDTGLTLGPIFHEFGWPADDWDKVAAGTVAGHIIECGAQASGGNLLKNWRSVKGLENPGFPIVEASADGSFVVTKHAGTGGVVSVASVTEQLVYEMGDPHSYITPDGIADFTTIQLRQVGRDRVRVSGIKGGPAHADAQGVHRLLLRLQGGRNPGVLLARGLREGARRRPHSPRSIEGPGARIRTGAHRVRRRQRHPRKSERSPGSGSARGAAAGRSSCPGASAG